MGEGNSSGNKGSSGGRQQSNKNSGGNGGVGSGGDSGDSGGYSSCDGEDVGKMRVPVRHLSSSKLECRPNELARWHFGGASKYSVAINSFVYFIS